MRGKVIFPKKLQKQFVSAAKRVFPNEEFAFLLGTRGEDGNFTVKEVYLPPGRENYSTPDQVEIPPEFYQVAQDLAFKRGWVLIGDMHSHCCDSADAFFTEPIPSRGDLQSVEVIKEHIEPYYSIMGICNLVRKGSRIYPEIVLYPALIPFEVEE